MELKTEKTSGSRPESDDILEISTQEFISKFGMTRFQIVPYTQDGYLWYRGYAFDKGINQQCTAILGSCKRKLQSNRG